MNQIIIGGIVVASLVVGLFFLKFWARTRDRFFLFFATSFWIEAVNRAVLGLVIDPNEDRPLFYMIRLVSFLLILVAIIDKNLTSRRAR